MRSPAKSEIALFRRIPGSSCEDLNRLQTFHWRPEIAVSGKQRDMIDMRRKLHGIHSNLDVHAPIHPATALAIEAFLRWLPHHGEPVAVEPVHERSDRRAFLPFEEHGAVERPQQLRQNLDPVRHSRSLWRSRGMCEPPVRPIQFAAAKFGME